MFPDIETYRNETAKLLVFKKDTVAVAYLYKDNDRMMTRAAGDDDDFGFGTGENPIKLDEVVITPDTQETQSTFIWFYTDESYDGYDGVENVTESGSCGGGSNKGGSTTITYGSYTIKKDDILMDEKLRSITNWLPQTSSMSCVLTAMEYAMNILLNNSMKFRLSLRFDYFVDYGIDAYEFGVDIKNLYEFVNSYFDICQITADFQLLIAIKQGYCILSTDGLYGNRHEILVVGYSPSMKGYICIDPATGTYRIYKYTNLNNYEVKLKNEQNYETKHFDNCHYTMLYYKY